MPKPIRRLQEICTVPGTDLPLTFARDGESHGPGGQRFRAIEGVPVLRREPPAPIAQPDDHTSHAISEEHIRLMCGQPGYTLMLGAGNSPFTHPQVVDVEFDLYATTDVVADAHELPFHSETFELFVAMNVFEHLREPSRAAREALRVLKPGGRLLVQSAFLQPLHGEPAHYYNATEQGLREWFRDFATVECRVSKNFNPLYALSWLSWEVLHGVGPQGGEATDTIGRLTLSEMADFWRDSAGWRPDAVELFFKIPEASQRRMAAGFELHARKPA